MTEKDTIETETAEECYSEEVVKRSMLILVKQANHGKSNTGSQAHEESPVVVLVWDVSVDFLEVGSHVHLHDSQHEEGADEDE